MSGRPYQSRGFGWRWSCRLVEMLGLGCLLFMAGCAQAGPAKAARKPALTNYHGVVVADDYQWLEDETNAEVQSWTQTQHLVARAYLDRLPARSAIEERIEELFEHTSSDYYGARAGGGVIYCLRLKP